MYNKVSHQINFFMFITNASTGLILALAFFSERPDEKRDVEEEHLPC